MNDAVIKKNQKLVIKLVLIAVGMFGFGYALVPLYNVFCDLTGINGKTENVAAAVVQYEPGKGRDITMEFVTSLNKSAPMQFKVETNKMSIQTGQYYTVNFFAKNLTDKVLVARAIPSVAPGLAAEYLKKVECFCFSQQKFMPGEAKTMPVRFVIQPDLPERYKTVTLSYTFFDITDKSET